MQQQLRKKNLAINLLFIVFASMTMSGSIALFTDKSDITTLTLPPSSLNGVIFEDYPATIDVQTTGYVLDNQLVSPRDSYYYNYDFGDEPDIPGFSEQYVDSEFIDENYGSASNMLKPAGSFRIDPAVLPSEYSPDIFGPDADFQQNYGKYGVSYDEYVDEAIKSSVEQSHYINAWSGQVGDEDTVYSIIFPVKDGFNLKSVGITFCEDYARYNKWGSTMTSCYGDDWIKGTLWTHQSYHTATTPSVYNNYLGGSPSLVMMPTENILAKRIYIYRILYSDDYYNWYNVNTTALASDDYSAYWNGGERLFYKNGIPDRTSFELSESTLHAKVRSTVGYEVDPFNYYDSGITYTPVSTYYSDPNKADPLISSNFLNTPTMSWNDFNLTENNNINPKYVQVRIEKILYTAGSMFGLGRSDNGKFQGVPEIGEIKLRYEIDENNNNYENFEDASINYPINNSMIQANPFDTIPLDFSYYYKADNMLADSATASINDLYFYLDGDNSVKYNLLNNNPNPTITIHNPITDTYYDSDITKNSWVDLGDGFFSQNPLNSLSNLVDVNINTATEYGGLYDVNLELSDIGSTTLDILYSRKYWDYSDINGNEFATNLLYEDASAYTIKENPTNDSDKCMFLDEGDANTFNTYKLNIPNNYSTNWEKGTNVQFKLINGGSYTRSVSAIDQNGEITTTTEEVSVDYDDYIAFYFNATLYFNMKDTTSIPTNEYIKTIISICIPISGDWTDVDPNNLINTEFNTPYIILDSPQYTTLRNNQWTKYSFNDLGLIAETILRDEENLYMHEANKGGLYSFEFSNLTLITINNPTIENDFICIDDVEVINYPFVENVMNKFELLYERNDVWSKAQSIVPDVQNIYLINNENEFENPINKIAYYYYSGDVYKYYNTILPYLGRSINYTFNPILLSGNDDITARIQWLNTYQYGYTQYNSQFYTRVPNQELFQFGHFNIKNIYVQATDIEKDWVSYNKLSSLLSRNSNYLEQESQLKCAVLRNAFASASHSSDVHISYMQTNIGEFTNIYSNSPNADTYFQITMNMPVSSYYDICIRDSYDGDLFDNNSYAIYIDNELYRVISQSNSAFEQVSPYLVNNVLYTSTASQSYNSLSQIPLTAYETRPEYQNGEIIRIASDYFTAGFHTIKVKLYNTASSMKFRYDQILLFYQSIRSFNIPVAHFESLNTETDYHSITVHIENDLDGSIKETTTNFQLYTKPFVNFNGGFLPDNILNFMVRSDSSLRQESYLNAQTISNAKIDAVFYDTDLDDSTFKYKIDSQAYISLSSDIEYSYNDMFYKVSKDISSQLSELSSGMHTITISGTDFKNHESQAVLVFYYDIQSPQIALDLENSNLKVAGSKYNITSDALITFDVLDDYGIQSIKYSLGKTIKVGTSIQNQTYTYYSRDINLTDITQSEVILNIPKNKFDYGDNNISIEVIDKAGNKNIKYYIITKEGFYTYLNVSAIDWLNYATDVDLDIKSIRVKSYSSAESKISTTIVNQQDRFIKLGISDIDTYDYIDQHLTLKKSTINGISLIITTDEHITRFPLEVQLLTINKNIISSGIIFASTQNYKTTIDLPNIIINEEGEYILRIIPQEAQYNIYNIFLAEGSSKKFALYGYKNGLQTKIDNYLAFEILGKGGVVIDNYDTYGDIQYQLNSEAPSIIYTNGICQTTLTSSLHGLNTLKITSTLDNVLITSDTFNYLWFDPEIHTAPNIDIMNPIASVYKDNITIKFYYSYPEYLESYNIQLFLVNTEYETEYWLSNFTASWDTITYNNNYITTTFNSNLMIDEQKWLVDSSKYYIKVFIIDNSSYNDVQYYNEKTTHSQRFTINNQGIKVAIKSPIENQHFNYKLTLDIQMQTYSETVSKIYYYLDNDAQTKNMLSYNYYNFYYLDGSKVYYYSYTIDINNLVDGTHTITIVFEDNLGKKSQDSVSIVKDTFTSANIIQYTPTNPYDDSNIVIYYENPESYKKLEIYMLYRHTYGGDYGFELVDEVFTSNINGTYEIGKLEFGIYDFTFRFIDEAGNIAQDSIHIEVKESGSIVGFGKAFRNLALTISGVFGVVAIVIYKKKDKNLVMTAVAMNKIPMTSTSKIYKPKP